MKKEIVKRICHVLTLVITLFNVCMTSAQVGFGKAVLPIKEADLTLESDNKGLLVNNVKLESITSPAPLDPAHMEVGMLVYNTNVVGDLREGFHYWTSENRWMRMYVKTAPSRDMEFVTFKQTNKLHDLSSTTTTPKVVNLTEFDHDYVANRDGLLFLDFVIYGTVTSSTRGAANIMSTTVVTDNTGVVVFTGVTALSTVIVTKSGSGWNASTGMSNFSVDVKKGKTYKIRTTATELFYPGKQYHDTLNGGSKWEYYEPLVGDFEWNDVTSHSSMKVTFMTEPIL